MVVDVPVLLTTVKVAPCKPVRIELTLERVELVGSKVAREQDCCELLRFQNQKGVPLGVPTYYIGMGAGLLDLLKHRVKFNWESYCYSPLTTTSFMVLDSAHGSASSK